MHRIEPGEPYFHDLRERWSAALRAAHQNIPRPPYGPVPPQPPILQPPILQPATVPPAPTEPAASH